MRRRLLERVMEGSNIQTVPEMREDPIEQSIIDSLRRIFGSVYGDASTDPHYGLPDIGGLARSLPGTTEQMREAIVAAIERYEPRLCSVRVLPIKDEDGRILRFNIVARRRVPRGDGQQFKVATHLQASGHLVIAE